MKSFRIQPLMFGLVVIALGIVWLLRNVGLVDVRLGELVRIYWPIVFIIWGIDTLVSTTSVGEGEGIRRQSIFSAAGIPGLILVAVGVIIIGRNLGLYHIDFSVFWRVFWPAVIILIGWSIIQGASGVGGTHWAVMSGIELKTKGWNLEDGNFIAIMGGVDLDLAAADIPQQEVTLNLTAVMGGITVKVPEGLAADCAGTAVLGGVNFLGEEGGGIVASRRMARPGAEGSRKKVTIRARALMGGIDVKQV